ncbi:MAG: hypothetical protein ONB13_11020, partial [candidate division KSB1 bacterium]|nr:hypothetical protein [candidate division KSB1 bacterium]
ARPDRVCGTFRRITPTSCYEASCPVEFGLSSSVRPVADERDRLPYFGMMKPTLCKSAIAQ